MADTSWLDDAPEAPESFLDDAPEAPEEKPGILRSLYAGITKFPYSEFLATVPSARRMGGMNAPEAKDAANSEQQARRAALYKEWDAARKAHPDAFNTGSGLATGLFTLPLTAATMPAASQAPFASRVADATGRAVLSSAAVANGLSESQTFGGKVKDTALGGLFGGLTGWLTPAPNAVRSEVVSQAARPSGMTERAGVQAVKAHGATPTDIANLQHKNGGQGRAGDEVFSGLRALETETPDGKPVLPFFGGSKRIANRYADIEQNTGRGLGAIKDTVDEKNPNAIDVDDVLSRAQAEIDARFDTPEMRGGHGPDVAKQANTTLRNLENEFAPQTEVARNIEYPTPEQAQTSLLPQGKLVPGPDATFTEPSPVHVANEVGFDNGGLPLLREVEPPANAGPGGFGALGTERHRADTLGYQRDMFGEPVADPQTIPGNPVFQDVSASGNTQGLGLQQELRGTQDWRVNDAGPVVRRHGTQSLTSSEKVKGILGDRSRMTKSNKYPDRNPEAIAADPDLAATDALRAQYRAAGERAVERELGPGVLSDFLRLKGEHGFSKTMGKIAHNKYNGVTGSEGELPVNRHSIARALVGPTHAPRARLYYNMAQAGKRGANARDEVRQTEVEAALPTFMEFLRAKGLIE